jgi:hypothetical protein
MCLCVCVYEYQVSASGLFLGGLTGGMGTFILFWTMAYDIVHIYGWGAKEQEQEEEEEA